MTRQELTSDTAVDSETAKQALDLAIKIQQERSSQLTLSELQRSAAEVGIAPEHVSEALQQISATKEAAAERASYRRHQLAGLAVVLMLAVVVTVCLFAGGIRLPAPLPVILVFVVALRLMKAQRRGRW